METGFDYALLAALIVLVPANSLWRTLSKRQGPALPRLARYGRTIGIVAVLLALLAADWIQAGRSLSDLGLDLPPGLLGLAGLGVAILLIGGMVAMVRLGPGRSGPGSGAALMPQTPTERWIFILFSLAVGIGWELLYRGFLMWSLIPALGLPVAIVAASLIYGLAHGYQSRRLFVGSLISAFLFVGGYVATGSLWWLMLVHSALPLVGLWAPATKSAVAEPAE